MLKFDKYFSTVFILIYVHILMSNNSNINLTKE